MVGSVYTIEFQKRVLPHCHMLLILSSNDKPRTIEHIDKIVSAEIPDPEEDPELYQAVSHMLNGPCGTDKPDAPCMKNGKCSKNYPRCFQDETAVGKNPIPCTEEGTMDEPIKRAMVYSQMHTLFWTIIIC